MPIKWNLVDELSGEMRAFSLPLAGKPPDIQRDLVMPNQDFFKISEGYLPQVDGRHTDVRLHIDIESPTDLYNEKDGDLPHPAIRLHAMYDGWLFFKPTQDPYVSSDKLILFMPRLKFAMNGISWCWNWIRAGYVPETLIYENVNKQHLEELLNLIPAAQTEEEENPRLLGLKFPNGVLETSKSDFISRFLDGERSSFFGISVKAGACIGTVAPDPIQIDDGINRYRLTLSGRYQLDRKQTGGFYEPEIAEINAPPFNTREFFHLLFGEDSDESKNHPLLTKINKTGLEDQDDIYPVTCRMLLRPPLRTSKRIIWEAQTELDFEQNTIPDSGNKFWSEAGQLQINNIPLLYNKYIERGETAGVNYYEGANKCNVFVFEMAARAGFRVPVFLFSQDSGESIRYYLPPRGKRLAKALTKNNPIGTDYQGENLRNESGIIWGMRHDKMLTTVSSNFSKQGCIDHINFMIEEEGRSFFLCSQAHVMLVKRVLSGSDTPVWKHDHVCESAYDPNFQITTLEKIKVAIYEYQGDGLGTANELHNLYGGSEGLLILVELFPGYDPDVLFGNLLVGGQTPIDSDNLNVQMTDEIIIRYDE